MSACRFTPVRRANLRPFPGDGWEWQVVGKEFPAGPRYQGVVSDGMGNVIYRTRYYQHSATAGEHARNRTVHHNLWHSETNGSPVGGHRRSSFCLQPRFTRAERRSIRTGFRA